MHGGMSEEQLVCQEVTVLSLNQFDMLVTQTFRMYSNRCLIVLGSIGNHPTGVPRCLLCLFVERLT